MKYKITIFLATAVLSVATAGFSVAATDASSGLQGATAVSAPARLTAGEVRKVDLEQGKLTIKHEVLENLSMPAMTMVFKVADKALLKDLKQGDKIRFRAEQGMAGFEVVNLEQAK